MNHYLEIITNSHHMGRERNSMITVEKIKKKKLKQRIATMSCHSLRNAMQQNNYIHLKFLNMDIFYFFGGRLGEGNFV